MSDAPLVPRVEAEPCATDEVPAVAPLPPEPKPNPAPDPKTTGEKPKQDMPPVGQKPMDWLDIKQRLDKAEEAVKTLSAAYDTLQAQAFALVWMVPEDHTMGDIRELRDRFTQSFKRAHELEAENAALRKDNAAHDESRLQNDREWRAKLEQSRKDAQNEIRHLGDAVMDKVNGERRTVTKLGEGYSGPGEVVTTFRTKAGKLRFVVAHKIEGGAGEFFHIYGEREIDVVRNTETGGKADDDIEPVAPPDQG